MVLSVLLSIPSRLAETGRETEPFAVAAVRVSVGIAVGIVSAVAPHRSGEISGSRTFNFFSFLATRTAHTREQISTHDSTKDAV